MWDVCFALNTTPSHPHPIRSGGGGGGSGTSDVYPRRLINKHAHIHVYYMYSGMNAYILQINVACMCTASPQCALTTDFTHNRM